MNKPEFSKKIVRFTGIIFTITVLICIALFVFCTLNELVFDWTGIVTLLTVTAGAFTASVASYESKAKIENIYKIKKSFLEEKYTILKKSGLLTSDYATQEIMDEVQTIDYKLAQTEETDSEDNTTNFNITL